MNQPLKENLSPAEIKTMLEDQSVVLIDVREPQEYAAERIRGALLFPLSTFDAHALPLPSEKPVVFQCGSGKRSATAIALCRDAGIAHTSHMTGGIQAWKNTPFPVIGIDPASGSLFNR